MKEEKNHRVIRITPFQKFVYDMETELPSLAKRKANSELICTTCPKLPVMGRRRTQIPDNIHSWLVFF